MINYTEAAAPTAELAKPGTYAVVADIHGQYDLLMQALKRIEEIGIRKIVFLGDYVHRGPDSPKVLQHLMNPPEGWEYICLCGNHEDMELQDFGEGGQGWGYSGTLDIYGIDEMRKYYAPLVLEEVIDWMSRLKIYHFEGDNVFAHAYYNYTLAPSEQNRQECLWRRLMSNSSYGSPYLFLTHGHTPHGYPHVDIGDNRLNLDIGGMYGKELLVGLFQDGVKGPLGFMHVVKNLH